MVKHRLKHGSAAFRPRKRASSQMPTINFWPESTDKKMLGFAGYKVGMTHYIHIEQGATQNKGNEVACAGTVVEVPPIVIWGIRTYDKGGICLKDILTTDEKILKELCLKNSDKPSSPASSPDPSSIKSVYVLCATAPKSTGFGKKTPDIMEIAVGGKDAAEKVEYAKSILGKQVNFAEIFKPGEFVDTISVTKGKGLQGPAKRFGISLQRRKATGKRRHVGTLGPWTPSYVMYTAPMAGQMGYHKRTDLNKQVVKIGAPSEINTKGGYIHYGNVKTSYVLIKGSVSGPAKRLVRFRRSVRAKPGPEPQVMYVSLESKQ